MARRTLAVGGAAVALVVAIGAGAIWRAHSEATPQQPKLKSTPAKQFGDDADLMRRLQRKNLVTTSR